MLWGIGLQFIFALVVLRWSAGYTAFKWLGDRFTEFLGYADHGSKFVFGPSYAEHFIAFKVIRPVYVCEEYVVKAVRMTETKLTRKIVLLWAV